MTCHSLKHFIGLTPEFPRFLLIFSYVVTIALHCGICFVHVTAHPFHAGQKTHLNPLLSGFCAECVRSGFAPSSIGPTAVMEIYRSRLSC